MSSAENGVAPVWVATGDGNYSIPDNWRCIGFFVEVGGDIGFTTNGTAITPTVEAGYFPAQVDSFQATGTTATGIYAMLVR
ncbi:hypothetical protein ROJ8625_04100 [Roseivivax jejudonensis]|uniref:Uncharacterized protein n=1 Tax=Roseivivax jejudonensis TaxID=1529041 RepID=A0A1X7ABM7_9RHOB|nr:hypothetical protein [Roseivivax jejudonensis]SLN74778.1 hypothetical protein ROJ8625_04100 [Roseivivax jejudonensis]